VELDWMLKATPTTKQCKETKKKKRMVKKQNIFKLCFVLLRRNNVIGKKRCETLNSTRPASAGFRTVEKRRAKII
jgi:hypothetical protein